MTEEKSVFEEWKKILDDGTLPDTTNFAQLDDNNIVTNVIVISEDDLIEPKAWWDPAGLFTGKNRSEEVGIGKCQRLCGDPSSVWKESLSKQRGYGPRGNPAGIGMTYMTGVRTLGVASTDIFIRQQPFPSWSIGIDTAMYLPPGPPGLSPPLNFFEKSSKMDYYWDEEKYKLNPNNAWVLYHRPSFNKDTVDQH